MGSMYTDPDKTIEELLAIISKVYWLADGAPECDNKDTEHALCEIVTETFPTVKKFDIHPGYVPTTNSPEDDHAQD